MDEPFRLLFLAYPANIETVNLRQHQRIPCLVPATAKRGDASYDGVLLDLSLTGCCFAYDRSADGEEPEIGPGQEMGVSFHIAGLAESPIMSLEVVNVRKSGSKVAVGGSFKDLQENTLAAVRSHIEMIKEFADMEAM
jgi:PilZ domain